MTGKRHSAPPDERANLGDGVGLRGVHFSHLMRTPPVDWGVDWFEIISENFIDNRGYAAHVLEVVTANRPVVRHGVSLSIGSIAPLDWSDLRKLRAWPKLGNGRPPIGVERMLRIYFLQQWSNLSDPAVKEALYDSHAMRGFVGIDLGPSAPARRNVPQPRIGTEPD